MFHARVIFIAITLVGQHIRSYRMADCAYVISHVGALFYARPDVGNRSEFQLRCELLCQLKIRTFTRLDPIVRRVRPEARHLNAVVGQPSRRQRLDYFDLDVQK